MRHVVMASVGAAVLGVGIHAGAAAETCMLELEQGVVAPWQGSCWDGKAYGEGVAHFPNGTYRGSAEDGRAHGHGRLTLQDGGSYVGEWSLGNQHGQGRLVDAEGDSYEGEIVDGKPQGHGTGWSPEGGAHTGRWDDGNPVGWSGTDPADPWDDGSQGEGDTWGDAPAPVTAVAGCRLDVGGEVLDWSGSCRDGKAFGEGQATAPDGSTYVGFALNGRPHGFGTVNAAGDYYQGEYRNGVPHGKGIVRADGKYYRAEFRDGYQHSDRIPMEGVAAADPWADYADEGVAGVQGTAGTSDPWANEGGLAVDDPSAPENTGEDPWVSDDATPVPGSSGYDPLDERVPSEPVTDDFDYAAALEALDGADGIVRSALPEDDYTAKLTDLERLEAERRATEIAREADLRAEQLREEIAAQQAEERRAKHEAEQASQRAALEREAVEAWREPDESYDSEPDDYYESEPSDSTLFGGGEAGQQAFEQMLESVVERAEEHRFQGSGTSRSEPCPYVACSIQ